MSEKRTDQAEATRQAQTSSSKGKQAGMGMKTTEHVGKAEPEPERRPDDEEIDTAAEQRPPSDS
jgi:hypothetical protein